VRDGSLLASASANDVDPEPIAEGVNAAPLAFACLELPYVPDFDLDDLVFWFVPSRAKPSRVFQKFLGKSAKNWSSYYSRKGWKFIHAPTGDGPFRVQPGGIRLDILPSGRIFTPRPRFRFQPEGPAYPLAGLEKLRPVNPWKPSYLQALNFIKRYEWRHPLPHRVQAAVWEVEECGQVPGSTSWRNAEAILLDSDSEELQATLVDLFYHRPETYELGSAVYLRVLGKLGRNGFDRLTDLAKHPVTRKRITVAKILGELEDPKGIPTLLLLLEDEDFDVRKAALRSLCRVGVDARSDPNGAVRAFLDSEEVYYRVWAAGALAQGGDESQRKVLLGLVKEDRRPLSDLGELGEVVVDLKMLDAVPYLIQRLKSDRQEVCLDAAETLAKLTGVELEFSAQDSVENRGLAIKAYTRWWEDAKRRRSAERQRERDGA
jgi:HEAT repeat protein